MLHVVLYQPRIPPNTGNIIRLSTPGMEEVGPRREHRPSANTGARLHLIEPLGFRLDDRELRRAGLDYHEWVEVQTHPSLAALRDRVHPRRLLAFSTRARRRYAEVEYRVGDALLFGSEARGLPTEVWRAYPKIADCACRFGPATAACLQVRRMSEANRTTFALRMPWPWWRTKPGASVISLAENNFTGLTGLIRKAF